MKRQPIIKTIYRVNMKHHLRFVKINAVNPTEDIVHLHIAHIQRINQYRHAKNPIVKNIVSYVHNNTFTI
jgi:hypothetical protein